MALFDISNYINSPIPAQKTLNNWKENIDYSQYDETVENKYRQNRDYVGLADYLSHFRFENEEQQNQYDQEISQLRRVGREYNALQAAAPDKETSYALAFNKAVDDGLIDILDNDNTYKTRYSTYIERLGGIAPIGQYKVHGSVAYNYANDEEFKDKPIPCSTISVTFNDHHISRSFWGLGPDFLSKDDDENQFTKFLQDKGYSTGDIANIIGENNIYIKDGKYVINIPKSNINAIKLLSEIRDWSNNTGRDKLDILYESYTPEGERINTISDYIAKDIDNLSNLFKTATHLEENTEMLVGATDLIQSSEVLPFINELQMKAYRALVAGQITDAHYNALIKADNDVYNRLLVGIDWSKYKVYTNRYNEEGNNTLEEMTDNIELGGLQDYMLNAIREDRLKLQAANINGEYGAMITVLPYKEKGELAERSGDSPNRSIRLFIPGLFTKGVQSAFNSSTQGKTVNEMTSMQKYGYTYDLIDGGYIKNLGNNGATYFNNQTKQEELVDRPTAQRLIHESIIIDDASKSIKNRMYTIDGQLRPGYNYEDSAKLIAVAGANELYPETERINLDDVWFTSEEERLAKLSQGNIYKDKKAVKALGLYSKIVNIINGNNNY